MTKLVNCESTGTRMPEATAREVDALAKTLPSGCGYRTKAVAFDAINFEPGQRAEVSIITTNSVDISNEVVLPEGVDMQAYRKNPVVLWNHDPDRIVGSCEWIKHYRNSIRAKTVYPEDGTELSHNAWLMLKCTPPILRAKSIGFLPRRPLRDPSGDEVAEHPEWKGAGVWDDVLMIEYSVCSTGCNTDALVEAVNTKSVNSEALKEMGFEIPSPVIETPSEVVQKAVEEQAVVAKVAEVVAKSDMSLHDAIAYVQKNVKKKPVKKRPVNIDELFARALAGVDLDVERIVRRAIDSHNHRGRV